MKKKYWYRYFYNKCPHCGEKEFIKKERIGYMELLEKSVYYIETCGPCEDNNWAAETVT